MVLPCSGHSYVATSMKVPSNRRGNRKRASFSPSVSQPLNESPSEKEGKFEVVGGESERVCPSMKVPPKRKGNNWAKKCTAEQIRALNESPSEKEGKSGKKQPLTKQPENPQ